MEETINGTALGIFRVEVKPGLGLEMFFAPFIETFALKAPFVLFHFQCELAQGRLGGIYDGSDDTYRTSEIKDINLSVIPKLLGLDSRLHHSLPNAVVLFENCKLRTEGAGTHMTYFIEEANADSTEPSQ